MATENSEDKPTAESGDKKNPEIVVDEDWKKQVKDDDVALDQKLQQEKQNTKQPEQNSDTQSEQAQVENSPTGEEAIELPPVSFTSLIGMFSTQAMVGLGIIPNPVSGKAEPQPALARHFIDLMGVIEEKTKGNLDVAEKSMLTSTLQQLRMAVLHQSNEKTSDSSGETESSAPQD